MKRISSVLVLLLLSALTLAAQSEFERGFIPSNSYQTLDFDSVDLLSGNLILHIPILSYPQRGSMPDLTLFLVYNGKSWNPVQSFDPYSGYYGPYYWNFSGNGVRPAMEPYQWRTGLTVPYQVQGVWENLYYHYVAKPDGSRHLLGETSIGKTTTTPGKFLAVDHSGYSQDSDKRGIKHVFGCSSYSGNNCIQYHEYAEDPNENRITKNLSSGAAPQATTWTDTVGRSIPIPPGLTYSNGGDTVGGTGESCTPLQYPKPHGGTATYTFCYDDFPAQSAFQMGSGYVEANTTFRALASVELPNGKSWSFSYNTWGDLVTVGLPTGGTVTYEWEIGGTGWRRITSRIENTGTPNDPQTRYYAYSPIKDTDPAGNETIHTFDYGHEIKTEYFQKDANGQQQPVKTVEREFIFAGSFSYITDPHYSPSQLLKRETTEWPNGQVSQVCFLHDNNQTKCEDTDVLEQGGILVSDTNSRNFPGISEIAGEWPLSLGNERFRYEYDFGNNVPGALRRKTETAYKWQETSSPFLAANLLDRVASVTVREPNDDLAAQTRYGYDESGRAPTGCYSSAPWGLQTSIIRENGSTDPATLTSYNCNGMPTHVTDPGSHTTQYGYDSSGMFVNQITYPTTGSVSHVEQFTTDFNTGVRTSFTDQNSKVTSYTYDSMRRILTVSNPDGGGTTWSYNSDPTPPMVTRTIESDPDPDQVLITRFDRLGRLVQTQQSDPEGDVYVDTTYTNRDEVKCSTNPYRSGTPKKTCYEYDALGRTAKVTRQDENEVLTTYAGSCTTVTDETGRQRKSCTDRLGRMNLVHEPNPSTGSLTSGYYETLYTYNVLDNLTYVNQKGDNTAPRTRSFAYDQLSRLTQAQNPESGTITYSYTPATDCAGDSAPCSKTDARSATMTYKYDALHRIWSKSDGTNTATYAYDSAPGSFPVSNPVGRLVQSSNGTNAARVVSYDEMGRVKEQWDCLAASCTYNQTPNWLTATYNDAGQLSTLLYSSGRKVATPTILRGELHL